MQSSQPFRAFPGDYLEVLGFLSFGFIHRYTNVLTRIRLLADVGSEEDAEFCRQAARDITHQVDEEWSRKFLRIWYTRGSVGLHEVITLDTASLEDLYGILQSSCRHFSSPCTYSIDENIFLTGSFYDLNICLILPAVRFCSALPPGVPKQPFGMSVGHDRAQKAILVEYRFPAGSDVAGMLGRELEFPDDRRIQWSGGCKDQEESLLFKLPAEY